MRARVARVWHDDSHGRANRPHGRSIYLCYEVKRVVPPEGFEPSHLAPEASALSPELWGLALRRHAAKLALDEATSLRAWLGRARPRPPQAALQAGATTRIHHTRHRPETVQERPCLVLYAGNWRPSFGT